jgi:uncharacterized protein (TIGR02246 family)
MRLIRRRRTWSTVATVVLFSAWHATPATAAASDEAEIRAVIGRYAAAAHAQDLSAVMQCYAATDALVVYDVSNAPFHGVAAVTKDWADFFAAMQTITLDFRDIAVTVLTPGKFALVHFIERASVVPAADGRVIVNDNLRTTQLYAKRNGRWQIVHEHKSKSQSG